MGYLTLSFPTEDVKFMLKTWRETHRILGTKLMMSMAFHLQTDGATEWANRSVGKILQTLVQPNQTNWVENLPMVEFAMDPNISSSTGFAPFELNYGYMPVFIGGIIPIDHPKLGVKQFVNLVIIKSHITQMHQVNKHWQEESPIAVSDKVYLSTENLVLPKGRSRKLMPKFIGPYPMTEIYLRESR